MHFVHEIKILVPAAIHSQQLPLMIELVLNDPEVISFLRIVNTADLETLPLLGHRIRQVGVLRIQQVVSSSKAAIREHGVYGL